MGFFIMLAGQFGWLGHFLLLPGWLLLALRKELAAAVCGLLALAIACHTFNLFNHVVELPPGQKFERLASLGIGFWLWLLSMAVLCIACMIPPPLRSPSGMA